MSHPPLEEPPHAGNSTSFFAGAQNFNIIGSHFHVVHPPPPSQPSQAQPQPTTSQIYPTRPRPVLYQQQMLHQGRGFPLWFPSPSLNLPREYRLKGFSIGDVGYFTPEGGFEFLFNILLPANHPINGSASNVPEGFVPHSPLSPRDIREHWDFDAGAYISSPSVRTSRVESSGLVFRSTSSEGAILTMPHGACKTELSSTTSFQRYVKQHAESWYKFVNGPLGRNVANGELRLVYGCDKSTAWGVAAFANTPNAELKFSRPQHGETSYSWEHAEMAETTKVGPGAHDNKGLGRQGEPPQNQCLFLRTMTVTLANHVWEGLDLGIQAQPMFQASNLSLSDQVSLWSMDPATITGTENVFRLLSGVHAVMHVSDAPDLSDLAPKQDGGKHFINNISLMVVPHPSSIINKLLLRLYPDSMIATTTDAAWQTILPQNWLLLTIDSLMHKLRLKKKAVYSECLVYCDPLHGPLQPASNPPLSNSLVISGSTFIKARILQVLPNSQRAEHQARAGLGLYNQFKQTHDLTDIDAAIRHEEKALLLTPESDPKMPLRLYHLGQSFSARFQQTHNLTDIDAAIRHQEKAVLLTSEGDSDMPVCLVNLSSSFFTRFEQTHNLTDIDAAIRHREKAVLLTSEGDSDMPTYLNNLAHSFFTRFKQTHNLNNIDAAIRHQEKAVLLTSEGDSDMPVRLVNLSSSFFTRFEQTHNLTDIDAAIRHWEKAVLLTSEGDSDMPVRLANLGSSFFTRFEQTHNLNDIDAAIRHQEKAVLLTSEGDSGMPKDLNNLGHSFFTRFKQTHNLTDIDAAIRHQEKAVLLTSEGDSGMPTYLNNLGSSFFTRFEQTYNLTDIDAVIRHWEKAVLLTSEGDSDIPVRLANLGSSFFTRFEQTHDLTDIDAAIIHEEKAVLLTSEGDSDMPVHLANLGALFSTRFKQTHNLTDIDAAIRHQEKAVMLTADGDSDMPRRLSTLALFFSQSYSLTGNKADKSNAKKYREQAKSLSHGGRSEMPV